MKKITKISFGTILSVLLTIVILLAFSLIFSKLFDNNSNTNILPSTELTIVNIQNNANNDKETLIDENMIYKNLQSVEISFSGLVDFDIKMQKAFSESLKHDNNYNYFEYIKQYLNADIVSFNTRNTFDELKPYSDINAPKSVIKLLASSGFNAGSACGQNILNHGHQGITSIQQALSDNNIFMFGLNSSKPEMPNFIMKIDDLKIAFLQYTQSISNAGLIATSGYESNRFIKSYNYELAKKDIKSAKASGADIVLVYMHWNSDEVYKSSYQSKTMQSLANAGADMIVGSHIFSPMPFQILSSFDENGIKKNVPIIYSLGALLSSNDKSVENVSNIILNAKFYYNLDKKTLEKIEFKYTPLCIVNNNSDSVDMYYIINPNDNNNLDLSAESKEYISESINYLNGLYSTIPDTVEIY